MTMADTELILIRHGETAWNRARRIQGQLDTPLNDEGHRQARAAALRLATQGERYGLIPSGRQARVISSDLLRCRQTADPIVQATGLPVAYDSRLRERGYGMFEGHTYDEMRRDRADLFARWLSRDPDFDVEGGESLRTFYQRVESALLDLVRQHAGRLLILVTHGGVLEMAYRMCHAMDLAHPREFELLNASLNRIRHSEKGFEVLQWGDISHWRDALDDTEPVQFPI